MKSRVVDEVKQCFLRRCQTSTVVGVSHALNSRSRLERGLWWVILGVAFFFTICLVYSVFCDFYSYPSRVDVRMDYHGSMRFPAIAFCSLNIIHCGHFRDFMNNLTNCESYQKCADFRSRYLIDDEVSEKLDKLGKISGCIETSHQKVATLPERILEEITLNLFGTLPLDIRKTIGHQYEDFFKYWQFKKNYHTLKPELFRVLNLPSSGNCFVFNHNISVDNDVISGNRFVSTTGESNGLHTVLNIETNYYTPKGLSSSRGLKVVITNFNGSLNADEFGIEISPGKRTNIGLDITRITRLQSPYKSDCTDSWDRTPYTGPIFSKRRRYSVPLCQRRCSYLLIKDFCNCSYVDYVELPDPVRACMSGDPYTTDSFEMEKIKNESQCIIEVFNKIDRGDLNCQGCHVECIQQQIEVSTSIVDWPNDVDWTYENYLRPSGNDSIISSDDKERAVRNNLVGLSIFFKSLNIRTIEEIPVYDASTFMGDLGGALSLALGISVAMLFEGVFLAADIIHILVRNSVGTNDK